MIYLDYHATTPVDSEVLAAMLPYFSQRFGNASSRSHRFGWEAEAGVDKARAQVADLIGAATSEVLFTSGATEANNLALLGVLSAAGPGAHAITQVTEHKAVLDTLAVWEKRGGSVTRVGVDRFGRVDPAQVEAAITDRTAIISIMFVNNEIGTIQPIAEIGRIARRHGVYFHTDVAQAAGKLPIDVEEHSIDLLSISAHKLYGPKGVGALYMRRRGPRVVLEPQVFGGGQEGGMRSGTLAVPLIVGLGQAAEIAGAVMTEESARIRQQRDRLWGALQEGLGDAISLNGPPVDGDRIPANLSVTFRGLGSEADTLLTALVQHVAVSPGSACNSAHADASHVLKAIGVRAEDTRATLRFGLGRPTTDAEITEAAAQTVRLARSLLSAAR